MKSPLAQSLSTSALAFRGYDQVNLGRTPELLAVPAYRPIMERRLREAEILCEQANGKRVNLVARVHDRVEAGLDAYAEAIALIFAAEVAQVDLLREIHGIEPCQARMAFGYSLGELSALAVSEAYPLDAIMRVPLAFAAECAEMAPDVTMAVVFSRRTVIPEATIVAFCEEVTAEGSGAIAVSAILAPNTLLVIGERDTTKRLAKHCASIEGPPVLVRENDGAWPPLHTPLLCQRHIHDRATIMIREVPRLNPVPRIPVWSLVTGREEYRHTSGREVLRRWIEAPQRLWDVVEAVLASEVRTVLHFGPHPNVIPGTFRRVADNVVRQTLSWSLTSVGIKTFQRMTKNSWLAPLLPRRGNLLRAPMIEHVIVEDWLLENAPK